MPGRSVKDAVKEGRVEELVEMAKDDFSASVLCLALTMPTGMEPDNIVKVNESCQSEQ